MGVGTHITKVDLKSVYRIVPIHPEDRHLLGICWDNNVYVDQALPFGLRSAPKLYCGCRHTWLDISPGGDPLPDPIFG